MKTFLGDEGVKSDLEIGAKLVILFCLSGSTFPDSSFSREARNIESTDTSSRRIFTGNISRLLFELLLTVKHYLTSCCLFKEER